MGIQDWLQKREIANEAKKRERKSREIQEQLDSIGERLESSKQELSQTSSIDPRLDLLRQLDEYEESSTARSVAMMEHAMVQNQAKKILSANEEQNPGFIESLRVDINPEEQKREQEKMEKQRKRQEYIKTHPYAQIMEELLKHVKAKEEGKGNVYSGTSRESILAQYRYDNDRKVDEADKLDMFVTYMYEIEKCGGNLDDIPNSLREHLNEIKESQYGLEDFIEMGIQFMHYFEIIDRNGIENLEYINFSNPHLMKNNYDKKFSLLNTVDLSILPKEYEKFINAGNTR